MSENVTTITEARQVIEDERQRRAAAFWRALQSIQAQYSCTVTVEPAWRPLADGTFTLAVRVAVQIDDPPAQAGPPAGARAGAPEMPALGSETKPSGEGENNE